MSVVDSVLHVNAQTYLPSQVLVVIPALNEARHIAPCLRSLIEGDPFLSQARIVVADGGSTDGTQAIVQDLARQHSDLHLVHNPDRLQSSGINIAVARHASPDHQLMIRCDAHSIYPPNYVGDIVRTFETHPDAASVATVMDATGTSCFQKAAAWIIDTPLGSGGSAHRGGTKSGWVDHAHHAGFRLDWFKKIGGYDPSFSHNEDAEYDHRLGLAGGKVWLETNIRLDYLMRPNPRQLMQQYWAYGRGRAKTVLKHQMQPRLRQVIPVINLGLIAACLALGSLWPVLLTLPVLYLLVLACVSLTSIALTKSLCGAWAGVVLGIIHNAWGAGFIWEAIRSKRKNLTHQEN